MHLPQFASCLVTGPRHVTMYHVPCMDGAGLMMHRWDNIIMNFLPARRRRAYSPTPPKVTWDMVFYVGVPQHCTGLIKLCCCGKVRNTDRAHRHYMY